MVDSSKTAFLFAGQGAQYVGMGKDLYDNFPEAREIFDQANNVLGWDLRLKCFEGPLEQLKVTHICQPAVLTATIAAFKVFRARCNVTPVYTAGLSLGQYSALVASGVMSFPDALRLVRKRAELMDEAARRFPGKMCAIIGLDRTTVKSICLSSGNVEIANLNAPGQIVISGEKEAVDTAKAKAQEAKAKMVLELEVSGAFHSRLMWEAAMEFKPVVNSTAMNPPSVPVVCNVDAMPKFKVAQIADNLVDQIYKSVLWEDSMRFILSQGVTKFYEFGPGRVLKGLMRRIEPSAEVTVIEKKEDILALQQAQG